MVEEGIPGMGKYTFKQTSWLKRVYRRGNKSFQDLNICRENFTITLGEIKLLVEEGTPEMGEYTLNQISWLKRVYRRWGNILLIKPHG